MPVSTPTVLAHEQLTTDSNSYTTLSVSPTNGRPLALYIMGGVSSGDVELSSVSGLNVTWTEQRRTVQATQVRKGFMLTAISDGTSGTITITFTGTQTEAHYILVQGASDWEADPWMQPRGTTYNGTPTTSGSITMAGFKDTTNNGLLVFGGIGVNDTPAQITEGAGFTMLSEQGGATGGQFASIAEWKTGEDLVGDFTWTNSGHYMAIAVEIRASGVTGGKIRDLYLDAKGDGTDRTTGDPYTSNTYTPPANSLLCVGVLAARASGVPGNPTVTGFSLTWTLRASVDFFTLASPTMKLFVYTAPVGASPASGSISVDPPESWGSCSIVSLAVTRYNTTSPVTQTKTNRVDAQATELVTTFDTTPASTAAIVCFLGRSTSSGTATAESGYVRGGGSGAANIAMMCEVMSRHSNEGSPAWTPPTSSRMGVVALEIAAESGAQTIALGQVTETNTAQAVGEAKARAVGQVMETDLAQAVGEAKFRAVGQATETATAQPMGRAKLRALGQAVTTSVANAFGRLKQRLLGQVAETDTAQAITTGAPAPHVPSPTKVVLTNDGRTKAVLTNDGRTRAEVR